jgi:hypothetical protein
VVGMSGPSERAANDARTTDAQRRSQELELERSRLHDRLLETAESVRRSHEHTAETMEHLADTGPAEHASRRRRAAKWSRRLAKEEARQIAKLSGGNSREATEGRGPDDPPGTGRAKPDR